MTAPVTSPIANALDGGFFLLAGMAADAGAPASGASGFEALIAAFFALAPDADPNGGAKPDADPSGAKADANTSGAQAGMPANPPGLANAAANSPAWQGLLELPAQAQGKAAEILANLESAHGPSNKPTPANAPDDSLLPPQTLPATAIAPIPQPDPNVVTADPVADSAQSDPAQPNNSVDVAGIEAMQSPAVSNFVPTPDSHPAAPANENSTPAPTGVEETPSAETILAATDFFGSKPNDSGAPIANPPAAHVQDVETSTIQPRKSGGNSDRRDSDTANSGSALADSPLLVPVPPIQIFALPPQTNGDAGAVGDSTAPAAGAIGAPNANSVLPPPISAADMDSEIPADPNSSPANFGAAIAANVSNAQPPAKLAPKTASADGNPPANSGRNEPAALPRIQFAPPPAPQAPQAPQAESVDQPKSADAPAAPAIDKPERLSDASPPQANQANSEIVANAGTAPVHSSAPHSAPATPDVTPKLDAIRNAPPPSTDSVAQAPNAVLPSAADTPVRISVTPSGISDVSDFDALALRIAAKSADGDSHFLVRLDPPDLGRIEVALNVDSQGNAQASLSADKPQTLDLLQRDAPQLERALRDAGLDLAGGLSFSLKSNGGSANWRDAQNFNRGRTLTIDAIDDVATANASLATLNSIFGAGTSRLDITV